MKLGSEGSESIENSKLRFISGMSQGLFCFSLLCRRQSLESLLCEDGDVRLLECGEC